jgi:hypothetical protein
MGFFRKDLIQLLRAIGRCFHFPVDQYQFSQNFSFQQPHQQLFFHHKNHS